ncbi:ABC transporter permease [Methanobacterium oryzae]|uniref:ABC transporter permease n=1 Tax=Methanobacterium oryzae TaxID=69540 RepID=UPI003D1C17F2
MQTKRDDFTGTAAMIKLILRRDRIVLPVFIIFMALIVVGIAASFVSLYSDAAARQAFFIQIQSNPSIVALLGSVLDPSIGGLTAWRTSVAGPIIIGLISLFLMIRHTRSEERKGRLELLDSTAVGRQAALTSAFITTFGVNIIIAVVIWLGLMGLGLPAASSIVLSLSMALFGCLFAAIAGVCVQLTESSGDARYLSISLLVAFFVLRILGWDDGGNSWISWLSPFGWVHYVRPFAGDELWVLGIFIIFIIGLVFTAYWLSSMRDIGSGIITQRPGPATASKNLKSSFALAWRLHRGMFIFWTLIFVLMGIMLGFTGQTVNEIISTNPQFMSVIMQLGGDAGPADSYFAMVLAFLGEIFAVYAILATLKLRSEESKKHLELVLSNGVSRKDWALSNLVFAVLGPAAVMIMFAVSFGLTYGLNTGNLSHDLPRILNAALVYLPAVWIFTGISMTFFGLIPRLTALSWVALGLVVIIDLLGEFFDINQLILDISPFTHVPKLLAGDSVGLPIVLVLVAAAILMVIGIMGFQRRDITD